MPDDLVPSEFGGKTGKNRVQPPVTPLGGPGHIPSPDERRMLLMTTGFDDNKHDPDNGEAWEGIEIKVIPRRINRFPGA